MIRNTGEYFGYKHWTLEEIPRCFNVGRGRKSRPNDLIGRNHKHKSIVKQYGIRVEICAGPFDFDASNVWEIEQIAAMGTFSTNHSHDSTDIGCNFTRGGGGTRGSTLGKIGDDNPSKRPEVRDKISKKLIGHKPSAYAVATKTPEIKAKISQSLTGLKQSNETKQKRSLAINGKKQHCSICHQIGHKRYRCHTISDIERQHNEQMISLKLASKPGPNKGQKLSIEWRQKIKEARLAFLQRKRFQKQSHAWFKKT